MLAMALRGDDEMFSLLDLMGGQTAPLSATSSSSAKPPSPVKKLLKSDGKPKSKKRGGERRHKMTTSRNQGGKGDDGSSETQRMSFAESRMIQNCFLWPCSDDGTRVPHWDPGYCIIALDIFAASMINVVKVNCMVPVHANLVENRLRHMSYAFQHHGRPTRELRILYQLYLWHP